MKVRRLTTSVSMVALLAAASLALGACIPPGPPATFWNGNVDVHAESKFVHDIVNTRAYTGRPALVQHGVLTDKARWWSQQMASGVCNPRTICHSQLTHRINGRVASWSLIAENVGVGTNLQSLWNAFMNSPAHRGNILDPRWHYFGVGAIRTGNTYWVTMVFMRM